MEVSNNNVYVNDEPGFAALKLNCCVERSRLNLPFVLVLKCTRCEAFFFFFLNRSADGMTDEFNLLLTGVKLG